MRSTCAVACDLRAHSHAVCVRIRMRFTVCARSMRGADRVKSHDCWKRVVVICRVNLLTRSIVAGSITGYAPLFCFYLYLRIMQGLHTRRLYLIARVVVPFCQKDCTTTSYSVVMRGFFREYFTRTVHADIFSIHVLASSFAQTASHV
jgi:hypothetical protein